MTSLSTISPVERYLSSLHTRFRDLADGAIATYIPELARANPNWFGISVATVDGRVYEVGDTRQTFTIQSISKPFIYGLALEDRGQRAVLERVGVEPTGDAFNEISLESGTGRPRNPMINAGAITATSLVLGNSSLERWARIRALFSMYAGHNLGLDEVVYRSERDTGHRNRAISHMLRNFDIIERDPEPDLDLYFRQCAIEVTCRDLSVMAATLASDGINPLTRERTIRPVMLDKVLSVMTSCGMYDYAGEWAYRVGLPAKSGVSGGILAVLPGQLGIGVFSPRLDERGNSVRGVAVCKALSEDLELHFLRPPRAAVSAVRARFTLRNLSSKRIRTDAERKVLAEHCDAAAIYQLQGDLRFAGVEAAIRRLVEEPQTTLRAALDFSRVTDVDGPASHMLIELFDTLGAKGIQVAFVGLTRHTRLRRALEEACTRDTQRPLILLEELDLAVEWCEDALLAEYGSPCRRDDELSLADHELLKGIDDAQLEVLANLMERRSFRKRELVVRRGETAHELFLVVFGELSVFSDTVDGRLRRLATLSSGMAFGEPSMVEGGTRSAFVQAERASVCWVLSRAAFESLDVANPKLRIHLLQNLLRSATKIIARMTVETLSERL